VERLGLRLILWVVLLTGVFAQIFWTVARFDPLSVEQMYRLRLQAREAQIQYGLAAPPWPTRDSGRANLPPYLGRGRGEVVLWLAILGSLGALGSWLLARPVERPLRQLAESCRALEVGEPLKAWPSASAGPLGSIRRDFAQMLTRLQEQERLLQDAAESARLGLQWRRQLLDRSYGEFRSPLREMLQSLEGLAPHPYLETIRRNLEVLLQLIDDLAQDQAPVRLMPVELGALVQETLSGLDARIEVLPGPKVWVESDRLRLGQILLNLVSNALKYSDERVTIGWSESAIWVEDRGAGLDPKQLPELMREFRQLDSASAGVGLGLATARRWMEMLGGSLQLQTQPGQGTRAWMNFTNRPSSSPAPGEGEAQA